MYKCYTCNKELKTKSERKNVIIGFYSRILCKDCFETHEEATRKIIKDYGVLK